MEENVSKEGSEEQAEEIQIESENYSGRKEIKERVPKIRESREEKTEKKLKKMAKRISHLFEDVRAGALLQVDRTVTKRSKLISARDKKGRCALHVAAGEGGYQICSLLLRRRADINAVDEAGNTPLHHAAKQQKWELCEMLIDKGASKSARNSKGKTPSSYGLDEALAEISMEEERMFQKQDWISEERTRFSRNQGSTTQTGEAGEREWREKLLDEHCFEHLEGSGYGADQRFNMIYSSGMLDGWFAADDDALDEDDWWAAIARQMRRRHAAFTSSCNAGAARRAPRASDGAGATAPPSQDRYSHDGPKEHARMAWERKWAKEGERPVAACGAVAEQGFAARAATHALAWERFLAAASEGGGETIRFSDVPWPTVPAGGDLATEAMMLPEALRGDAEARRRAVREALRRWHPDKFGQRFGGRLAAADRDRILERVKTVSQALTALVQ